MYLQLAPTGPYADEVKGVLAQSTQKNTPLKGGKSK
jgi:hypothetical protein